MHQNFFMPSVSIPVQLTVTLEPLVTGFPLPSWITILDTPSQTGTEVMVTRRERERAMGRSMGLGLGTYFMGLGVG